MTEELKEAAQQVVDAFDVFSDADDFVSLFALTQKMRALRIAIQQPEPVVDVRCKGCGYMTHHREHMGCVRAAKQHTHPAPSVPNINAAARKLSECMDYPWEHMPEKGRANMCEHAASVIDAAMLAAKDAK